MQLEELRQRLVVLNGEAQQIEKTADEEIRDLSVEEAAKLDGILTSFERIKADIDRLEKLNEQTELLISGTGRRTQPDQPVEIQGDGETEVRIVHQKLKETSQRSDRWSTVTATSNWNFKSLGDFALSVKRACVKGGALDRRLSYSEQLAAASTYGSEGSGSDGGFAVPPDFRTAIMSTILGEESLLARCDQITVSGNSFTAPIDETTPWQTSGGILANWEGEAAAAAQSKPSLKEVMIKLNKLRALVPMTEEILEDSSAMDAYLRRKAPEKIAFKINLAIIQGTGVGMPLGLLNAGATVSVAKETSQTADTFIALNAIKMYNAMYAANRSKAVWFCNQELEPMLLTLSIAGKDNVGNFVTGWGGLMYVPPGGLSAAPFGTMFGRPVIPTQACPVLGDRGDIIFADLSQYLAILKSGPNPRVDVSMHLWFDQDLTAFKFVLRMGGTTWWTTPATALAGSATYSPFVTLAERA